MVGRKPLSSESLEKLAVAREKALEKKKQLKEQRLQEAEEKAKNEILEEQDEEPSVEPPSTPPKAPKQKPQPDTEDEEEYVPRKPRTRRVQNFDLNDDDLSVIKEFVQTTKAKKKQEKWENRKKEILDDVINRLTAYEPEAPVSNLSLFNNDYD